MACLPSGGHPTKDPSLPHNPELGEEKKGKGDVLGVGGIRSWKPVCPHPHQWKFLYKSRKERQIQQVPQSGKATWSKRQTTIKARITNFYHFFDIHTHNSVDCHHTVKHLRAVTQAPQASSTHINTDTGRRCQITRAHDPRDWGLTGKAQPFGGCSHYCHWSTVFSPLPYPNELCPKSQNHGRTEFSKVCPQFRRTQMHLGSKLRSRCGPTYYILT